MAFNITGVIQDIGWDKAYSLPTANAANAQLEKEIHTKSEERENARIELESFKNRSLNINDNLKNVKVELTQVQQLIKARHKEMEAEDHMFQLAYREDDWLNQDMEKLKKAVTDLEEKCNRHETMINKQQSKLREINEELHFDEKALVSWLDEVSKHDDDVLALQKYSKQDEEKMKELIIQVRGLNDTLAQEKQNLSNLITDYRCCQMEMNKTAEEYTQLHEERHSLIKQWESAIKQMKDRDREINGILQDMTKIKTELQSTKLQEEIKTRFLNQLKSNNQEVETAMIFADKNLTKFRDQFKKLKTQMTLYSDDLRTVTSQVTSCAGDFATAQEEVKHWRELATKTKEKHAQQIDQIGELQQSLANIKGDLMTSDEKATISFKHVQNMEARHKCVEFELIRLMDVKYRKSQDLERIKASEKTLASEIQGCKTAIQNLKKRMVSLEKMAQRQEEVIYGQDVVIQQLEDRISRITGNTRAEEKKALENKVAQLEETFTKKDTSCNFLNQQIKLLEEDTVRVKRELVNQNGIQTELNTKMKDLNMEIDAAHLEIKSLTNKKQNLIVEENMLKLHIKKLKDQFLLKADDCINLEKQKLELDQAMKEHHQDINIQREMLRAQFNSIEEEKHFLTTELNSHRAAINKLKNRYEVLVSSMSACAGVSDDDMTCHVQYFIQAVQEKQKLQLEGDELDAQVLKAEKEVIALENTLRVLNSGNDILKKSFNPVTKSSEEHEEKQQLEEQLRSSKERLIMKKRERNELLNESEQLSQHCGKLENDTGRLEYNRHELRDHLSNLGRRMEEQYAKLDRASIQNAKYVKGIRPLDNPHKKLIKEYDFDLRILRDANKFLIKSLETYLKDKEIVADHTNRLLDEARLPTLKIDIMLPREDSSISLNSRMSFCTTHGSGTTSAEGSKTAIVNIGFDDLDISPVKNTECSLTRIPLGVRKSTSSSQTHLGTSSSRCCSDTAQAPSAQRIRLVRKVPSGAVSEGKKPSTCSLGNVDNFDELDVDFTK